MNKGLMIVGGVLMVVGALWVLQGLGIVGGSFMTGQRQWLVIGVVTGALGFVALIWANLRVP